MRKLFLALLSAALCTVAASAQDSTAASSSPIAYVYISTSSGIAAYSAATTGVLTKIPGSPFSGSLSYLAGNGKYLFGSTNSGTDIESYKIESNGALQYVSSENVVSADGGCGNANQINLDHTGSTLYDFAIFGDECTNNTYETFSINNSTGKLSFIGDAGSTEYIEGSMSFLGNDLYSYTTDCYHYDGGITGFKRASDGKLTQFSSEEAFPNAGYCGYAQATDPTNHVAIAMQAFDGPDSPTTGIQLGTFTASSTGKLTTTSTEANMPTISVGGMLAMNMAPSGKLLAVAGPSGLQVYHFNGASPITHYTGLLTTSEVDSVFWDNNNHLYAIGTKANKLWVFTVTPTSASQAKGSPYTVKSPEGMKVLPL